MTRAAMENLVKGLLSGQSDLITVPIELKVPRALYQTYQVVAQQYDLPIQQALENLANQGIQKALSDSVKINAGGSIGIEDLAKQHGIDLTPLTEGLGRVGNLVDEMKKLQKAFEVDEPGTTTANQ